jgi:polyhydroxybutyrate depolymerase
MLKESLRIDPLPAANHTMLTPGEQVRSIEFEGRTRTYLVHVPRTYDPPRPSAVVLAFHGGGTNAKMMVRFSGLSETANRAGFLVIYPNGSGRNPNFLTWNVGHCCGHAMRENVDDVGFARAVLDDLDRIASMDATRVFATGISNGGMMAYRLASELSDRIAAIASVAGPVETDTIRPTRPVSVLHFHGTSDEFVPFGGGRGKKSLSQCDFRSVEVSVGLWIASNKCPANGVETSLPNRNHDGTTVAVTSWGPGNDGSEVVLYTIQGGGHTWPGRIPPTAYLGPSTTEISANDLMWAFFAKHPLRA